jgi:hypothetical protein
MGGVAVGVAVLDRRAVEPDLHAPAVGTEFMGRARQLRQEIEAEDRAHDAIVDRLMAPIRARFKRHPNRPLRQLMLNETIARWMAMEPSDYRLSINARLDKGSAHLREVRLDTGRMKHPDWENAEEGLGASEITLTVESNRARIRGRSLVAFSLHSIARRLERGADDSIEALLHDLYLATEAVSRCPLRVGADYRITTGEDGRGWRGRVLSVTAANGLRTQVLSIRTWLER